MRPLAALLALSLVGCIGSPTEPSGVCGNCAAPGAIPPSADAVHAAMVAGRNQAAASCTLTTESFPAVEWRTCDFYVANAIDTPGGRPHGVCASGLTTSDGATIRVSLADPANVLPLVTWETRNSLWIRSGCGNQAFARPGEPVAVLGGPRGSR